jgi:hypothetical protein
VHAQCYKAATNAVTLQLIFGFMFPRLLLVLFLLLAVVKSFGQQSLTANGAYPQGYFSNPTDLPILLAGNFGECRPGHFHSGIDIRTKGEENHQIFAAADGYISRIKMEPGGFGHALYITHPNGYTTLYAHLNDFAPALQLYVRAAQYENKRWNVDINLPPEKFPVKQGELIAYSGNTGGSTAPHLHFEIRNTKTEHPLNPMLFGLPIVDGKAPVINSVALYSTNIYTADPKTVALKSIQEIYRPWKSVKRRVMPLDTITVPAGMLGIGINVDDYMNESDNTLTFYKAYLYVDDSLQSAVTLDDIGYDETRYLNAFADYKTKQKLGRWYQCFFKLPGNRLGRLFNAINQRKGWVWLAKGTTHKVEIVVADCNGNKSRAKLYVAATAPDRPSAEVPSVKTFYAGKANNFSELNIAFGLDETQLYDDIKFVFERTADERLLSDRYNLHFPWVPLHHYFPLQIRPVKPVPFQQRGKVVLNYSDGRSTNAKSAEIGENGFFVAKVRNFGTYWLGIDTTAPTIGAPYKSGANLSDAQRIAVTAKDSQTSISKFAGYIDGSWVCFEQSGGTFFYTFDEHCSAGKHTLTFSAEDESGNVATYTLEFNR